ncbi:MAG TPA: hypothetical protein PLL20_19605 [Phycisphaerae bacterium]|nr:hypothetical protein [Phycisphaerae bacterium]HRR86276.1 hypothetical protein [Phycisphaerae bacterium]
MIHQAIRSLIVLFAVANAATATPILLSSYEAREALDDIRYADVSRVGLMLELYSLAPPYQSFTVGGSVYWQDGQQGTVDFTTEDAAGFNGLVGLVTNGIEDQFSVLALFEEGGGGSGGPESWLLGRSPDLAGYRVDFVRLSVEQLSIGPSPGHPGASRLDYQAKWEMWGEVVPEPTSSAVFVLGVVSIMSRWRVSGTSRRSSR